MKFSTTLTLAAAGQAAAGAISHRHAGKVHNHALRHAEIKHAESYVPPFPFPP
jgi:hypothetical protein